jgi:UPF0755 protein
VARVMVGRALRVFEGEMELPGARQGLTMHELVTLASIVEAEAGMASERPRIAAVFYNRLKMGMMLQSDPTVMYAQGIFKNRVFYSDLNVKSPYNTYRNRGLPPGPICSPGRAAMHAVLFPNADSTEVYFVARGDGTHIFSKTWEQHLAAIAHVRAVTREESTTTALAGPMPEPPTLRALPDSMPDLRAQVVSAPAKAVAGKSASGTSKRAAAVSGKTSTPKSATVARKTASRKAVPGTASRTVKKASGASSKETLRPTGPPAPETPAAKKRKKRAVKS